jgi:hypothetical protein
MRQIGKMGGWVGIVAAIVLAARTLAYALAPDPRAEALGQVTGGPRPVIVGSIALGLAAVFAGALLWLSALGVRERHRLRSAGDAPRLRILPVLLRATILSAVASIAFGAVETTIHVQEGLGFHGLHCLTGPVHENALPLIAALSLAAAAIVEGVRHAVAFARRVVAAQPVRRRVPRAPRAASLRALAAVSRGFAPLATPSGRGPPVSSFR